MSNPDPSKPVTAPVKEPNAVDTAKPTGTILDPHHPPAGTGTASGGTTYPASDGTPVTVQIDANGQVVSAKGTGKDGVARTFSAQPGNPTTQTYTEATSPPLELTVSVAIAAATQVVTTTFEAGQAKLIYALSCAGADKAKSVTTAILQRTATRFTNGVQTSSETLAVAEPSVTQDCTGALQAAFSQYAQYKQLVSYFAPVLTALGKTNEPAPKATPKDEPDAGTLGAEVLVAGLTGVLGAIVAEVAIPGLAIGFLLGADTELLNIYVNTPPETTNPPPPTPIPPPSNPDGPDGSGGDGCFVAGTQVLAGDAVTRSIEGFSAGAAVLAFDEATGSVAAARVEKLHVHSPRPVLELLVDGIAEPIGVTAVHRFLTQRGWVPAAQLVEGDTIRSRDPASGELLDKRVRAIESTGRSAPVFNLSVAPHHTYFVEGLVVHNVKITDTGDGTGTTDGGIIDDKDK